MGYSIYATKADLLTYLSPIYLSVDEEELPDDIDRLLKRASELVQISMRNNYDNVNVDHINAAKLATCAQVEYWLNIDESVSILGKPQSVSMSSFNIKFKDRRDLCLRAHNYLSNERLLYAGVSL